MSDSSAEIREAVAQHAKRQAKRMSKPALVWSESMRGHAYPVALTESMAKRLHG